MLENRPFAGEVYFHWCATSQKGYVGQTTQGVSTRRELLPKLPVKKERPNKFEIFKTEFLLRAEKDTDNLFWETLGASATNSLPKYSHEELKPLGKIEKKGEEPMARRISQSDPALAIEFWL